MPSTLSLDASKKVRELLGDARMELEKIVGEEFEIVDNH